MEAPHLKRNPETGEQPADDLIAGHQGIDEADARRVRLLGKGERHWQGPARMGGDQIAGTDRNGKIVVVVEIADHGLIGDDRGGAGHLLAPSDQGRLARDGMLLSEGIGATAGGAAVGADAAGEGIDQQLLGDVSGFFGYLIVAQRDRRLSEAFNNRLRWHLLLVLLLLDRSREAGPGDGRCRCLDLPGSVPFRARERARR